MFFWTVAEPSWVGAARVALAGLHAAALLLMLLAALCALARRL